MSTKFLSPGWRMPRNANQSKSSNYSLDFDGSQYIDTNYYLPAGTKPKSISYWFKNTDPNGWSTTGYNYTIHGGALSTGAGFGMGALGSSFGSYLWFIGHSTGDYLIPSSATGVMTTNVWYHIVVTYDNSRTNNLHFYLDGVKIDETNETLNTSTANSVKIGASATGGGNSGGRFMEITDVCFFDYALSESQVTTLWGGGTEVSNPMALPRTPIAYYPLGTSAWNGEYLAENNAIGDYVFDFGGGDDYINAGSASYLNGLSNFTFSSWVNISTLGTYDVITSDWSYSATASLNKGHFTVCLGANDGSAAKIRIFIKNAGADGGSSMIDTNDYILNTNKWYHVLFTYNSGTVVIYINGVSYAVTNFGTIPTSLTSENSNLNIGRWQNVGRFFDGFISNVQIFKTALSGPEAETLYNYGSPIQTLANIPQNSNLKAWYKLDASEIYNSSSTDWSVDNNQNPSVYASSLDFSGTSQYISCSSSSVFQNTSNFSVSFWVNMDDYSGGGCLLMSQGSGSNIFHIYAYSGNTIQVRLRKDGLGNGLIYNIDLNNKWSNISLVYDGTQTGNSNMLKFYLNKVEQTINFNSDIQSSINISSNFLIGQESGQSGIYTIDGKLSNVSLFSNSLTDGTGGTLNQIETLYNNGTPLADMSSFSSLASWWKLDNTTTGIEDSKGTNNGTNNGATEYPGFVNALAGDSSGMSQTNLVQSDLQTVAPYSKYALSFDSASSDRIDTGAKILNNMTSYTASIWAKGWSTSALTTIMSQYDGGSVAPLILTARHSSNTNGFTAWLTLGGTFYSSHNDVGFSDNTKWLNLTVTWDGSDLILYVNGIAGDVTSASGTIDNSTTYNFHIGGYSNVTSNSYNGQLSNCSIWNAALTSAQVTEIYNEGLPSDLNTFSGAAPVAWWQLGSNSSFNGNDWIVADEIGSNNGESDGMGVDALTNGVGTIANGVSSGMSEGSLVGDAPYSTANALSSGMAVTARGTDVPS